MSDTSGKRNESDHTAIESMVWSIASYRICDGDASRQGMNAEKDELEGQREVKGGHIDGTAHKMDVPINIHLSSGFVYFNHFA